MEIVMKTAEEYLISQGYANPHDSCVQAFDDIDTVSMTMTAELVHPLPGTDRVLANLHEYGCKIAIATSDRTERARRALDHLNLLRYIDLVVGVDQITFPKPDPETVAVIRDSLHTDLRHIVVVGDTDIDMELGARAGVKACIGVSSGSAPREVLMAKTPYVLDNVGQIGVEIQ
jgi:phosphoglycolate phosphatase-like HAD superfamily hydrolase